MKPIFILTLLLSCFLLTDCGSPQPDKSPTQSTQATAEEQDSTAQKDAKTDVINVPKTFKAVQLRSRNDAKKDPELQAFLDDLLEILRVKDVEGLLKVVSPDVKISFGADNGIENFKTTWGLDQDADGSKIWTTLQDIIEAGGTFGSNKRSVYTTPYYYNNFPKGYDPFTYSVITGRNVNVRTFPNRHAKTVRQLNYDIVIELHEGEDKIVMERIGNQSYPWRKIRMSDGEEGYVFGKYVQSPIGYRAIFEKVPQEGWKLYVLVAGD